MITIITGTPGAGKTLYAIEKLIAPLVGTSIKTRTADGDEIELQRTIYTNINGLQLEHELIDGGDNQGLKDWHLWAKPGAVIVFDEFQKAWPPRVAGSKVPPDIQALDTHRHMGVDFILITQSVMNTDKHIHALGGRHLHVRRVANMKLAVVYEWDHVSRTLMYSKAISKSPWRYNKKVFKLYRSAEVHTKQPRRIPGLVWFIILGIVAGVILGPTVYTRLSDRIAGGSKPVKTEPGTGTPSAVPNAAGGLKAPAQPAGAARVINDAEDWKPRVQGKPETAPAYDHLRQVVAMPRVVGAICIGKAPCRCLTQQRTVAEIPQADCYAWVHNRPFDPYKADQSIQPATYTPQQQAVGDAVSTPS